MSPHKYLDLKEKLIERGYSDEIQWAENVRKPEVPADFVIQFIWVVCNSGMQNQIAEKIYQRILQAICDGKDISKVFRHEGKVKAIKHVIKNQKELFSLYQGAPDKLGFCESLPWIGKITKYHLAKNLRENYIKPDRHLVRIAEDVGLNAFELCDDLSSKTGDNLHTVDLVLWRSRNLKLI